MCWNILCNNGGILQASRQLPRACYQEMRYRNGAFRVTGAHLSPARAFLSKNHTSRRHILLPISQEVTCSLLWQWRGSELTLHSPGEWSVLNDMGLLCRGSLCPTVRDVSECRRIQDSLATKQEARITVAWQRAVSLLVTTSRTVFQYFNSCCDPYAWNHWS